MAHLFTITLNFLSLHWEGLSALVGGMTGLAAGLETILRKLHIDSKKLAFTLLHLISLAGALSAYYLANESVLPTYAGLAVGAGFIHRFLISPYFSKDVEPVLNYLSETGVTANPAQSPAEQPQVAAPSFVS